MPFSHNTYATPPLSSVSLSMSSATPLQGSSSTLLQRKFASYLLSVVFLVLGASSMLRNNVESRDDAGEETKTLLRPLGRALGSEEEGPQRKTTTSRLLLGIFSTLSSEKEFSRRRLIRDTYLKDDPRFCSLAEYIRADDGGDCIIPYAFVVGAANDDPSGPTENASGDSIALDGPPPSATDEEKNEEDDVVYLNVRENMEEGKSVSWLGYGASVASSGECRKSRQKGCVGHGIDYIAKTDTDTLFYKNSLFEMIERDLPPAPYNRNIYGGRTELNPDVRRGGLYAAVQFYVLSSDLAYYVSHTLTSLQRQELNFKNRPIEDVDIGSYVMSHPRPVRFVTMSHHIVWRHGLKELEEFKAHHDEYKERQDSRRIRWETALLLPDMCKMWSRWKHV